MSIQETAPTNGLPTQVVDGALDNAAKAFERTIAQDETPKSGPERIRQAADDFSEEAGGDDEGGGEQPPQTEPQTRQRQQRAQPVQQAEDPDFPEINEFSHDFADPSIGQALYDNQDGTTLEGVNGVRLPEEVLSLPVRVQVNGRPVDTTMRDIVSSYQRQVLLDQRAHALNRQREEFINQYQHVQAEREYYAQGLQTLADEIDRVKKLTSPNWDELARTNPQQFAALRQAFDQLEQTERATIQEQNAARQLQAQQEEQYLAHTRAVEYQRLQQRIPAFADPTRAAEITQGLVQYGVQQGYTPEEISQLYDHRHVVMLYKAMLYDRQAALRRQARSGGAAPPAPQNGLETAPRQGAATPGPRPRPTQGNRQVSELTRAKQRLARTGTVADAASVFERMLNQSG